MYKVFKVRNALCTPVTSSFNFLLTSLIFRPPTFLFVHQQNQKIRLWNLDGQNDSTGQLCLSFNPWLIVISTCFHQALFITCLKRFLLNPFTSRLLILSQFYQLVQIQVHLFTFFGSIYCMFLKCFLSSIPNLIKVIRDSHKKKLTCSQFYATSV